MIVRIHASGKSFAGTAAYLTHDPQAQTTERVAWTHTLNLANDHVPSGVDEMLWTARDAELLKQEAGVRAGGRATENPVKHLSLNWSPEDSPSREHMVATTVEFLRQMKWDEHQAVLVAHDDKPYAHVHVMLNGVHPETGLQLDDAFKRRRASTWALEYEREQGRIYCEQRLLDPAQREQAAPRNVWQSFQENERQFGLAENALAKNQPIFVDEPKNRKNEEWEILKDAQRVERMAFFSDGKSEFSELRKSIYREVREEFRERWAKFYVARREGTEAGNIVAFVNLTSDQSALLDTRRTEACGELRASRDERYRELLDNQQDARAGLRERQKQGLDNAVFLRDLGAIPSSSDTLDRFHGAADEVVDTTTTSESEDARGAVAARHAEDEDDSRTAWGFRIPFSPEKPIISGVGSLIGSLFEDLINLGSKPERTRRERDASGRDPFAAAAEETRNQQEHQGREEADAEWRRRQRSHGD